MAETTCDMAETTNDNNSKKIALFSVLAATALMFAFFFMPPFEGLTPVGMKFLGIFIWWIVMMIAQLLPTYLSCIAGLLVSIIVGVSKVSFAFGAFSANISWLLIGAFGLSAALQTSGILKRLALVVMKLFPGTYAGQLWGISIASVLVAPTIPSTAAKSTFLLPIVGMISDQLGYKPHSKGATGLMCCAAMVTTFVGLTFMTGGILVVTMLAMSKETFTWMSWLQFAIVWGVAIFFLIVLFHQFYFNPNKGVNKKDIQTLDKSEIQARLDEMGKMGLKEYIALFAMVGTVGLWMTESIHHIPTSVVAVSAWVVLCAAGLFTVDDFNTRILWVPWAFTCALLGMLDILDATGVNVWISQLAVPVVNLLAGNAIFIIFGCAILACILQFGMVNYMVTGLLCATLLAGSGVTSIAILFACFTGGMVFVLSFQQDFWIVAMSLTGGRVVHEDIMPAAWAYIAINLIALAVTIPYWYLTGYIS